MKLLATTALAAALLTVPGTAYAGDTFMIQSADSHKCAEVYDRQTQNGAIVVQWGCYGGANQLWRMRCHPDYSCGYAVMLENVHSGKCMEVANYSQDNRARIQQWDCHGGPNQVWWPVLSSGGTDPRFFYADHSRKALEVYGFSKADGAPLVQWEPTGANNQAWYRI